MKQHYTTLGLQEGASQEEIEGAYKRLSKELDPANNDNQEFFKEEYKKLQAAYQALNASSILATKQGAKKNAIGSQKTTKDKTTAMTPKQNKITKKTKMELGVLAGILAICLGMYIFLGGQPISTSKTLSDLVYESQSTRWMQSTISNDIIFVKNSMKPFSGTLSKIRDNYDGNFVDGKKNGLHKEFKGFNDALVREGRFENGTPVGVHKNWYSNGQLQMEVTFSKGKREGLSKKWSQDGDLLSLDFDQNKILDYMTNYLNSSKTLNIVEGSYNEKNNLGYKFSVIKIFDKYYAIMTNNFRNGTQDPARKDKTFYIGDVKVIFSSTQETNRYAGRYFMADKTQEPVTVSYNIIGNYIDFNIDTPIPTSYDKKNRFLQKTRSEMPFKYYKK